MGRGDRWSAPPPFQCPSSNSALSSTIRQEFKTGRGDHPLTQSLIEQLSGACPLSAAPGRFPGADFDGSVSTAEFYRAPLESGFAGEHPNIRRTLDHQYHGNYTAERQRFQDALIRSNVILDGASSDRPWYVLTCGPMVSSFLAR